MNLVAKTCEAARGLTEPHVDFGLRRHHNEESYQEWRHEMLWGELSDVCRNHIMGRLT